MFTRILSTDRTLSGKHKITTSSPKLNNSKSRSSKINKISNLLIKLMKKEIIFDISTMRSNASDVSNSATTIQTVLMSFLAFSAYLLIITWTNALKNASATSAISLATCRMNAMCRLARSVNAAGGNTLGNVVF